MGRRPRAKLTSGYFVHSEDKSETEYVVKGKDEYHIERKKDRSGEDVIILKSGSDVIDIPFSALKKKLLSLFEVRNTRLHDLSQEHGDELRSITTIMSSLYNTSCYNEVIELIDSIFSKGGNDIKPGTVYAYFYGCKVQTNFTPFSCSPLCSGSIQPVDMGNGWETCDKLTILFNGKNRQFSVMNNPQNKEDAYIYIENGSDLGVLTDAEKRSLAHLGVKRIKVISYDRNNRTSNVNDDFIAIEDIVPGDNIQSNSSWGGWIWLWVLILVLLILLVIGVIFLFSRKGKQTEEDKYQNERLDEGSFYDEGNNSESMYDSSPLSDLGRGGPRSSLANAMTEY